MTNIQITALPEKMFNDMQSVQGACFANCLHAVLNIKIENESDRFFYVYGKVKAKDGVWTEHAYLMAKNGPQLFYYDPTLQRQQSAGPFKYELTSAATYQTVHNLYYSLDAKYRKKIEDKKKTPPHLKFTNSQWHFHKPNIILHYLQTAYLAIRKIFKVHH